MRTYKHEIAFVRGLVEADLRLSGGARIAWGYGQDTSRGILSVNLTSVCSYIYDVSPTLLTLHTP